MWVVKGVKEECRTQRTSKLLAKPWQLPFLNDKHLKRLPTVVSVMIVIRPLYFFLKKKLTLAILQWLRFSLSGYVIAC